MLNMILIGPPGAGKGTQAKELSCKYLIPHISTGDILRQNIRDKTALGKQAGDFIEKGLLVPDDLVLEILFDRLESEDCKKGYILDGFPRNLNQAKELTDYLTAHKVQITSVMVIEVQPEIIIERISGRLACPKCGKVYHIRTSPPKNNNKICDGCGGTLFQRKDDRKETVKNRLKVYETETAPLIKYYEELNLCVKIDGAQEIEEVFAELCDKAGGLTCF